MKGGLDSRYGSAIKLSVVTILTIVFQPIRRELGSLADNISQYTISEGLVSKILLDFRSYCDFRGMRAYPTTVEHFFPSYRYFPSGRFFFFSYEVEGIKFLTPVTHHFYIGTKEKLPIRLRVSIFLKKKGFPLKADF